ncbi:MAG: DoxX-like family protein [Methyloceanibacter sp.]
MQLALSAPYLIGLSVVSPELWTDLFGALLKVLPLMAAALVLMAFQRSGKNKAWPANKGEPGLRRTTEIRLLYCPVAGVSLPMVPAPSLVSPTVTDCSSSLS